MDVNWGIPPLLQISLSSNIKENTLRGMHALKRTSEEYKLVTCLEGSAIDCVVDLRIESEDYLKVQFFTLESTLPGTVIIPPGCIHGFMTTAPNTKLLYGMTAQYEPSQEVGMRWDDPMLGINWPFHPEVISDKDNGYSLLTAVPEL